MPPTPDRAELVRRAHAKMMGEKWAAATADIDSAKAVVDEKSNDWGIVYAGMVDEFLNSEFMVLLKHLWFGGEIMLDYAHKVEGKLKGTAGGGVTPPSPSPTFIKLKDWLDSANKDDLPNFPQCFALLEQLKEYCVRLYSGHMDSHTSGTKPAGNWGTGPR